MGYVKSTDLIYGKGVRVDFNRPATTPTYSAGAVVSGVIEFPNLGIWPPVSSGADSIGIITDCDLMIGLSSVPSGMSSFTLHLYTATPPSAYTDTTAWDLPSGDRPYYLKSLSLDVPLDRGVTLFSDNSQLNKGVRFKSTSLFAYLVTDGSYTAASATSMALSLIVTGVL